MAATQFQKGLTNILDALRSSLTERGVTGAAVSHDAAGEAAQRVHVVITVGEKSAGQNFEVQELEDSGEAIDAPAAIKVRMLVSQFVT